MLTSHVGLPIKMHASVFTRKLFLVLAVRVMPLLLVERWPLLLMMRRPSSRSSCCDDVALLQHAQARADDRRVREAKDLPPFRRRVRLDGLLEPGDLLVVDDDLVGGHLASKAAPGSSTASSAAQEIQEIFKQAACRSQGEVGRGTVHEYE